MCALGRTRRRHIPQVWIGISDGGLSMLLVSFNRTYGLPELQNQPVYRRANGSLLPRRGRQVRSLRSTTQHPCLGLLGLDLARPPPLQTVRTTGQDIPTQQALLSFPHLHQARRSDGFQGVAHLPTRGPGLRLDGLGHRTVAAAGIVSEVHDEGGGLHAQ